MANSTATLTQVGFEVKLPFNHTEAAGWAGGSPTLLTRKQFSLDITAAKADGAAITLAATGFTAIHSVRFAAHEDYNGSRGESGGYVHQYVPTTMPTAMGTALGPGVVRVYEAGADALALDEVVGDENVGIVLIEIEGVV